MSQDDFSRTEGFSSVHQFPAPGETFTDPAAEKVISDPIKQGGSGCFCGCIGCLTVFVLAIVGLALFTYLAVLKGKPLVVARETTHIVGPLKSDGKSVDYFTVVEEFNPLPPAEENGYVTLCRGFGKEVLPKDAQEDGMYFLFMPASRDETWKMVCDKLGLDADAAPTVTFTPFSEFYDKLPEKDREAAAEFTMIDYTFFDFPLYLLKKPEDFQVLAPWLEMNAPALDLFAEALRKPKFVTPFLRQNESTPLMKSAINAIPIGTRLANALTYRAMARIAAQQPEEAWKTIQTLLVTDANEAAFSTSFPVTFQRGYATTLALLRYGNPSDALLEEMAAFFETPQKPSPLEELTPEFFLAMRYTVLDAISNASADHGSFVETLAANSHLTPEQRRQLAMATGFVGFNWNIVAKMFNEHADMLVPFAEEKDRQRRREKLDELFKAYSARHSVPLEDHLWKAIFANSRSELVGDLLGNIINATAFKMIFSQYHAMERWQVLRLAVALERQKRADGAYPENLEALVPGRLASVPTGIVDPATPYGYVREAPDRYTLTFRVFSGDVMPLINRITPLIEPEDKTLSFPNFHFERPPEININAPDADGDGVVDQEERET